ncbi:hypothetical protein [Kibdelosporangium phytohabitans]|uniref:hypothetical protein n=1 Tax=Kibdelosporangium phytohabitans TaxID=860235 RepID=UPI0012FA11FB|nr:hypothetical protein [Kibdelosporangium phytohabitans]MBE1461470.1 hypothetical protein [Kibdelosporangium phytohabitans]
MGDLKGGAELLPTAVNLNPSVSRTSTGLLRLRAGQPLGGTYFVIRETGNLRELGESDERVTAVATRPTPPASPEPSGSPSNSRRPSSPRPGW